MGQTIGRRRSARLSPRQRRPSRRHLRNGAKRGIDIVIIMPAGFVTRPVFGRSSSMSSSRARVLSFLRRRRADTRARRVTLDLGARCSAGGTG
eukprot:11377437-Alexandrium_andersonii.AAC.1